jgi:hypothetical protein
MEKLLDFDCTLEKMTMWKQLRKTTDNMGLASLLLRGGNGGVTLRSRPCPREVVPRAYYLEPSSVHLINPSNVMGYVYK